MLVLGFRIGRHPVDGGDREGSRAVRRHGVTASKGRDGEPGALISWRDGPSSRSLTAGRARGRSVFSEIRDVRSPGASPRLPRARERLRAGRRALGLGAGSDIFLPPHPHDLIPMGPPLLQITVLAPSRAARARRSSQWGAIKRSSRRRIRPRGGRSPLTTRRRDRPAVYDRHAEPFAACRLRGPSRGVDPSCIMTRRG